MFYIPQTREDDCGFASLKMLLATYYNSEDYLYIPDDLSRAYSYKDIIEVSKSYGVLLKGEKVIDKKEISKNTFFPLIVTFNLNNENHAVLLMNYRFGYVKVSDPLLGVRYLPKKKFISLWDGTYLRISESCTATKEVNSMILNNSKDKYKLTVFQMCSAISGIIGIYFFSNETKLLSFIFVAIFLLCEILLRISSIKMMKQMDYAFLESFEPIKIKNDRTLKAFEDYKKEEVTHSLNIVFSLITAIFLIALLILNSYMNVIYVLLGAILAIFKITLIDPYIKKKNHEIAIEEAKLLISDNHSDYKEAFTQIHHKAYKIGFIATGFKYLFIILIIISVLITMNMANVASLNYLLFYSGMSVYLYDQLLLIFGMNEQLNNYRLAKAKLTNYLYSDTSDR